MELGTRVRILVPKFGALRRSFEGKTGVIVFDDRHQWTVPGCVIVKIDGEELAINFRPEELEVVSKKL